MRPEMPYLAAGAVSLIGGAIRDKKWPSNANRAIIGTVATVLLASASADTPIAPLVHAIGLLVLLAAAMAAIKQAQIGKTHG